jgi:glutamate-1-semialdehyde aminotransferase
MFLQGSLLTSPDRLPAPLLAVQPAFQRVRDHLTRFSLTQLQGCLAYGLSVEGFDRLVIGVTNSAELRDILAAVASLPEDPPDFSSLAIADEEILNPAKWKKQQEPVSAMTLSNSLPARRITNFAKSDAYRGEIHDLVAGGAHTYSRGDDQFPALAPAAIVRGKDAHVWDLDGNQFVDCGLGLGAISLGHAYEPVLRAVREQLDLGASFMRPAALEREVARDLLAMMPGMERVKFAKNGSNVTTAAVKLARAFTGRELVAFPKNHPFYSFDDWFIGNTDVNSGVPDAFRRLAVTYQSSDPASLEKLFAEHPGRIACVITEPEDAIPNPTSVIQDVERIAKKHGALFILDEMVTGFRAGLPGAYTVHGLQPDMTTWGKAIGNGFSFCALAGRADVMELGGIRQTERQRVFLLSSTHGGEAHVLSAAKVILETYRETDVIGHMHRVVAAVADGMRAHIKAHRLEDHIEIHASPWRINTITRDKEGKVSLGLRTLMMQEMIGQGVFFQGYFFAALTHTNQDIADILSAFSKTCAVYAHALEHGWRDLLIGEPVRPVFRKYNGCAKVCVTHPCPDESTCRGKR